VLEYGCSQFFRDTLMAHPLKPLKHNQGGTN
jgi:hypothetical protein